MFTFYYFSVYLFFSVHFGVVLNCDQVTAYEEQQ